MHKLIMLGTGLIARSYIAALHGHRGRDRVVTAYSRTEERARQFAHEWDVPRWTTDLAGAIHDDQGEVVVIGLPNNLHEEAVRLAAEAGKPVLCTKPLGRNSAEARRMLEMVEKAGVFHGYLEDLVYTPKSLKALSSVRNGAVGKVLWTRSRETHGGPHSDWFWDKEIAGGGAIVDLACHCLEIGRSFIGKDVRPMEVMCWAATQVHPIEAEDSAIGLVRYANGAISQFEVSWAFRGGMDLRDEVSGTQGTIWLNHWLRTGSEMFTAVGESGFVAEKAEGQTGWLFPVADEIGALGVGTMFADMLDALDAGRQPVEDFYDGYVINAIMDAAYRSAESKRWEPVVLESWRGQPEEPDIASSAGDDATFILIKEEIMADGRRKQIIKEKATGRIIQRYADR